MFKRLIEQEKNSPYFKYYLSSIIRNKNTVQMIDSILSKKNDINLAERSYNPDKAPPFSIKLQRPGLKTEDKKTTVKLLKSGKLNFDGANSDLEVCEIYYWTYFMYIKYFAEIVVDREDIRNEFDPVSMADVKFEDITFS
jgi:TATA-box binding protein (TBP) (component of TFIID and TFIIIB)